MAARTYTDRCPGVFRPWLASDGAIVRLRTPGGIVRSDALRSLVDVAERHGDGTVLITSRANLQVRGLRTVDGQLPDEVVSALRSTGLLPTDSHELVRNILSSPLSGRIGGVVDLRPVVASLDVAICAEPAISDLGGRFLFVLDDGRGDVLERDCDLGAVVVSSSQAQLRVGGDWGEVVDLHHLPDALVDLARRFAAARGSGESSWWHVHELPDTEALAPRWERDPRTRVSSAPPLSGRHRQDDGRDLEVIEVERGIVDRQCAERLLGLASAEFVVTPWRQIVAPDLES